MHGLRTSSSSAINRNTHSRTQEEEEEAAAEMATLGGTRLTTCNDRCGCPTPCPGGLSCRCATRTVPGTVDGHKKCSCGEHCGCNPCTCAKSAVTTGVGKAHCKCGDACTCISCAA